MCYFNICSKWVSHITKISNKDEFVEKISSETGGLFELTSDINFTGYTATTNAVITGTFTGKINGITISNFIKYWYFITNYFMSISIQSTHKCLCYIRDCTVERLVTKISNKDEFVEKISSDYFMSISIQSTHKCLCYISCHF